jgi:UDP-glucose 4-epimerase
MQILVTGGAGYIGSVAVKQLLNKGYSVIVVDNLSKGLKELVDEKAKFYEVDLTDKENLEEIFLENQINAIMHFAGYKAVGESMTNPTKYSDNITGTINLLDLMVKYKIPKIIYSSSAAVYGESKEEIVTEESKTNPSSYYGLTKLICEDLIKWYSKLHNLNYILLRYFNVAGDGGLKYIDPEAQNVIPIIMEAVVGKRDKFIISGNDYDTPDGTGIRDYIDINDLIDAHILALDLDQNEIINLGTNKGVSVKELVDSTIQIAGNFNYEFGERRPGDCATLIASNEKAKNLLNWQPQKTIQEMIKSTYEAYCETL